VHISAVERAGLGTLNEDQQVEYELVSNRGKSSAEKSQGEVNPDRRPRTAHKNWAGIKPAQTGDLLPAPRPSKGSAIVVIEGAFAALI
jgi:hypothetical protein